MYTWYKATYDKNEEQTEQIKEVWDEFNQTASSLVKTLEDDVTGRKTENIETRQMALQLLKDQVKDVSHMCCTFLFIFVHFLHEINYVIEYTWNMT